MRALPDCLSIPAAQEDAMKSKQNIVASVVQADGLLVTCSTTQYRALTSVWIVPPATGLVDQLFLSRLCHLTIIRRHYRRPNRRRYRC